MQEVLAVITGDLVRSSALTADELQAARERLRVATAEMDGAGWCSGRLVIGDLEFYRGDAWQVLIRDPRLALRAAIYLRGALLAQGLCDTRASIGVGGVDRISEQRVSLSTGEAFELSGRGLDAMGPRFRLSLRLPDRLAAGGAWLPVVVHLCDGIMSQWEGRQIETALTALLRRDATHREIGDMLAPPVTQQAVSKSLQSAGWHGLHEALEACAQLPPLAELAAGNI